MGSNNLMAEKSAYAASIIEKFRPLSQSEHYYYIALAKKGDIEAMDKMISHNLRLVIWVIEKHFNKLGATLDFDDLINEGYFGLRKAIEKFDLDSGHKFSNYATFWIKKYLIDAIRNSELIPVRYGTPHPKHEYDYEYGNEEDDGCNPESSIMSTIEYDRINKLIKSMPEAEQGVMFLRFGKDATLKETAKKLKVSGERIRHVQGKILSRIKKNYKDRESPLERLERKKTRKAYVKSQRKKPNLRTYPQ